MLELNESLTGLFISGTIQQEILKTIYLNQTSN